MSDDKSGRELTPREPDETSTRPTRSLTPVDGEQP